MAGIILSEKAAVHPQKTSDANLIDDIEIIKIDVANIKNDISAHIEKYNKLKGLVSETTDKVDANKKEINALTKTASELDSKLAKLTQSLNDYITKIYPIGCIYFTANEENPKEVLKFGEWEKLGILNDQPENITLWKRVA